MGLSGLMTLGLLFASNLPSLDRPVRTGVQSPKDFALVVGVERYPFLGVDVPYAYRDAEAFKIFLLYTRGLPRDHIQVLKGGSRGQILRAAQGMAERAKGGTLWIYFSGHGAASPKDAAPMLLGDTVKADLLEFEAGALRVTELQELAQGSKARQSLLILDVCYSGTGRDQRPLLPGARFAAPATLLSPSKVLTWSATSANEIAGSLKRARHGAFSYLVLGALRGWADGELSGYRDGRVELGEARAYVERGLLLLEREQQSPRLLAGIKDTTLLLSQGRGLEQAPELRALTSSPIGLSQAVQPAYQSQKVHWNSFSSGKPGAGGGKEAPVGAAAKIKSSSLRTKAKNKPKVRAEIKLLQVSEELNSSAVRRVLRKHLRGFQFCYEKRLRARSKPSKDLQIELQAVVGPAGRVHTARVEKMSPQDSKLKSCVRGRLQRLRFPTPKGAKSVQIRVSLHFKLVP